MLCIFRWVHVSPKCSMAVHFISTTQPAGYTHNPEVHTTLLCSTGIFLSLYIVTDYCIFTRTCLPADAEMKVAPGE